MNLIGWLGVDLVNFTLTSRVEGMTTAGCWCCSKMKFWSMIFSRWGDSPKITICWRWSLLFVVFREWDWLFMENGQIGVFWLGYILIRNNIIKTLRNQLIETSNKSTGGSFTLIQLNCPWDYLFQLARNLCFPSPVSLTHHSLLNIVFLILRWTFWAKPGILRWYFLSYFFP